MWYSLIANITEQNKVDDNFIELIEERKNLSVLNFGFISENNTNDKIKFY